MADRTTTSYIVLGLLALRPMTAYELNQQYKRSAGIASPRGETVIYSEPKRLVADGLATSHDEQRGRRSVAVYVITDEGRAELKTWLAAPSSMPTIEAEPVIRALFADQGDPDDLARTLKEMTAMAAARRHALAAIAREYVDGTGPYPDRIELVALTGRFAEELFTFLELWARWADEESASWPKNRKARQKWGLDVIQGIADRGLTIS